MADHTVVVLDPADRVMAIDRSPTLGRRRQRRAGIEILSGDARVLDDKASR